MFSVTVLHDDRIVLVAEQRPDASEEDSFQWMSRVLQVGPGGSLLFWPVFRSAMSPSVQLFPSAPCLPACPGLYLSVWSTFCSRAEQADVWLPPHLVTGLTQ